MTAAARAFVGADRRAMLAKVHLGAKELGLREDERRDVLERLTGHRSSADCTDAQLSAVLGHYKALGWTPTTAGSKGVQSRPSRASKPAQRRADHPAAKKARALWISLHQLGVVREAKESALEAFAARQLKVERLQWADAGQCFKLIEALKAMAERAGWSQDLAMVPADRQVWSLKARLVQAQARVLGQAVVTVAGLSEAQLDTMAKTLGEAIRARKVGQP